MIDTRIKLIRTGCTATVYAIEFIALTHRFSQDHYISFGEASWLMLVAATWNVSFEYILFPSVVLLIMGMIRPWRLWSAVCGVLGMAGWGFTGYLYYGMAVT